MDDRKLSTSPDHLDQVERPAAEPPRESSQIVYCGTEQQVREGFAIALRAMGVAMGVMADSLPGDVALPAIGPDREDN
jgi:hypothetical protein